MKTHLILLQTLAVFLSAPLLAQPTNINVPAKTLESYVGQYELTPGFVLTIRKEADRLTGQATGQPRLGLTARSETDFQVSGVDASVTFVKDKDGKVTQLILHQNGDHEARKTSGDVPKDRVAIKLDPKILDAYVGQYELAPEAIFTIRKDGEKLRAQLTGQASVPILPESETDFFYTVVDAQLTFVKDAKGKVTELVLHQNGDKTAKKISDEAPPVRGPDLTKIPARDPKADARLVDLTGKYNALLSEQWHPDVQGLPAGANHLGSLPRGIQKLGGIDFDVRGVIQLTGTQAEAAGAAFPEAQTGIKVGRKCKRLHFLQAAGWQGEDGKVIGRYVLHYAGGETASLNVVYGVDTLDWWKNTAETKPPQSATVVWTGSNPAADAVGGSLRLFKRTYDNPKPDLSIETLDFVSAKAESAPFLVAFTVED